MKLGDPSIMIFMGAVISILGALLGGIGAFRSSRQQAQEQMVLRQKAEDVAESQRELRKKSDEIAALNREIASAQVELRKKSDDVAKMSKKIAASVTGGDSFCYIRPILFKSNMPSNLLILHKGKYPMQQIQVRIVDIMNFDKHIKLDSNGNKYFDSTELYEYTFHIPFLHANKGFYYGNIPLPETDEAKYNVFFTTAYGDFVEEIRAKKVHNDWKIALRVKTDNHFDDKVLYEEVDKGYPASGNSQVDW